MSYNLQNQQNLEKKKTQCAESLQIENL